MLSNLESDHLFTFNFATTYQYCTTFTFPPIEVLKILNSAVSCEMLQDAFSFQNSVKVTFVKDFFNFKCVLQISI